MKKGLNDFLLISFWYFVKIFSPSSLRQTMLDRLAGLFCTRSKNLRSAFSFFLPQNSLIMFKKITATFFSHFIPILIDSYWWLRRLTWIYYRLKSAQKIHVCGFFHYNKHKTKDHNFHYFLLENFYVHNWWPHSRPISCDNSLIF